MNFEMDSDEWSPQGPVTELTAAHAWALLGSESLGRLALSVDDRPQIFPVNFVADGRSITFRTASGTKLSGLVHNRHVAFEADSADEAGTWSVVATGQAAVLDSPEDILAADALAFPDWVPTLRFVYVRVTPADIRGRRFTGRVRAERDT
jgi:nitroimidazol reductase NimA-like FMN-containing flavoprotein (pyridoxamine 5'-phosphate oxidase superfamily)